MRFLKLQYKNKRTSSPHFLASYIHEWIHSFHLDYIFRKYGYGGECAYLNKIYPVGNNKSGYEILKELQLKKLSGKENNIVSEVLGEYSAESDNQYLEIFSETFTKFICEALYGDKIVKNPLELLRNTPNEFQAILKKVSIFTQ